MSKVLKLGSGEVELSHPKRRHYSAEYKLRILAEVEACSLSGQVAALLRREGLYSSHLTYWWKQRSAGVLSALDPVKPGPKATPRNPDEARNKALEQENRVLKRKLKRAELLLEIQKKASELMGITLAPQFEGEESE